MEGNFNHGDERKPKDAGRKQAAKGRKAAIAIALAAAFAVGAFAGYGASSLGIWRHNDRLLGEREAAEARLQERWIHSSKNIMTRESRYRQMSIQTGQSTTSKSKNTKKNSADFLVPPRR